MDKCVSSFKIILKKLVNIVYLDTLKYINIESHMHQPFKILKMKIPYIFVFLVLNGFISSAQKLVNMSAEYGMQGIAQNGYGSGISFVDFDQDGDDDVTMGSAESGPFQCFRNDGSKFTNIRLLLRIKLDCLRIRGI